MNAWRAVPFLAPYLLFRARAARRLGRFDEAAVLYEEALRLRPGDGRLRVQCGHMRKEAGELAQAGRHYLQAQEQMPDDADLALQLGHLHKIQGRMDDARLSYARALALRPGWDVAAAELKPLDMMAALGGPPGPGGVAIDWSVANQFDEEAAAIAIASDTVGLVPSLAPRKLTDLMHEHREEIDVRRLGRREPSFWGHARTLRGVEAIRGFCVSRTPILELQLLLNGSTVFRAPLAGGYDLRYEIHKDRIRKYVFNSWYDFGGFAPGRYALELRFTDGNHDTRSFHDMVVIAEPLAAADHPNSDGLVEIAEPDPAMLEQRIREAPSMIRPARRSLWPDGVRSILVMRTDQLGDMVASIPAMRRLREIAPGAKIVGLLTAANAELARTLDLFDEIVIAQFPDDRVERRRIMSLADQAALRRTLEPYRFDIALDLAHSNVSRALLPLSGAKFLYGIGGGDWPWLSAVFEFNTRDRFSLMDTTPHSTKVLALVEALGTVLKTDAPIIRRADLTREMLHDYGVAPGERYVLLHAGARVEFSRWPHYPQLAAMLLDRTDVKVVMMSEDAGVRETLPEALLASDRFVFLDQRLPFDHFDAFISFATVVVGNDSGPKHLAALRGTTVVTLFTARINWTEWGQEEVGYIISRKVPCQGCAIFHDQEECGKGFACIVDIRPQEVLDTVLRHVLPAPAEVAA